MSIILKQKTDPDNLEILAPQEDQDTENNDSDTLEEKEDEEEKEEKEEEKKEEQREEEESISLEVIDSLQNPELESESQNDDSKKKRFR